MASIQLEQVSFSYPGTTIPVIDCLNLDIHHGSAHALLGASGAGKSTILGLLSGLLHPDDGRVTIDGQDVSAVGARDRNMALVFQFPVTYESISVLENLTLPLTSRGWSRSHARDRAKEIARELEIDHVLDAAPGQLPLYEKQLVAIGKSLVRDDVDLVLLDEPLTAVEPAIKWRLRQTLNKFQAAHELTMVYVTHDQTEALTFADTVSVMADGRILQTGLPHDVYQKPASRFVGEFIGSPGMQFASCEVTAGKLIVANQEVRDIDVADGKYHLGVRPDWVQLGDGGEWQSTSSRTLGTLSGQKVSLHEVCFMEELLLAEHVGDLEISNSIGLKLSRYSLFDGEKAIFHG